MKYKRELILSVSCLLLAFLLSMGYSRTQEESRAARIAPAILRFHVLANSDSQEDQKLKLEVKTLLLNTIHEKLGENATKIETERYIRTNQQDLETQAETYMNEKGYSYRANLELTTCYFPTKTYGDMIFPPGYYETARVTIGKGDGKNWWCVLYPPLCFIDSTYAVVPDGSKETLRALISEDDFSALIRSRSLKPARSDQETNTNDHKLILKFKLAELFQ